MSVVVTSASHGEIGLFPGFPQDYKGPVMSGGSVLAAVRDFGVLVFQEFRTQEFILRHKVLRFVEKTKLSISEDRYDIETLLTLSNGLDYRLKGRSLQHLRDRQYLLMRTADAAQELILDGGKEYHLFSASYTSDYLKREFLPVCPELAPLLHPGNNPLLFTATEGQRAHFKMLEAVRDLTLPPLQPDLNRLFFESKVREYMILLLASQNAPVPEAIRFTKEDKEAIIAIAQTMQRELAHATIPELARKARMNEHKFKVLFRRQFGMGPFEYLTKLRLQKARELLLETDIPIKNIHRMVGFTTVTGFITSFRREFGSSPGKMRPRTGE